MAMYTMNSDNKSRLAGNPGKRTPLPPVANSIMKPMKTRLHETRKLSAYFHGNLPNFLSELGLSIIITEDYSNLSFLLHFV